MEYETPRNLALKILSRQSNSHTFAGDALDNVFSHRPGLDDRDRAFISNVVLGSIRWRLRLDWILENASDFPLKKINPHVLHILRIALYQIFFLDRVPESAAVNEAVKQTKKSHPKHVASFVNGVLRGVCREKDRIPFPGPHKNPARYLSIIHSYPEWLVEKWLKDLGRESTEKLLIAGNRIPHLTIRTNTLKIEREELLKLLAGESIMGKPTRYSPFGITIENMKGRVNELKAFKEGLFRVQDEAAQITSFLLSPQPEDTILDLCSGLGGKATHLAELAGNKGRVIALDINHNRLISLAGSLQCPGLKNIFPVVADASEALASLFHLKADKIMVDAPCSGLGVISRHPDGKWNKDERDIGRLAELQGRMLHEASKLLAKGGKILYVTCTISRDENEGVVEKFLKGNKGFYLSDLRESVPEWGRDLIDEHGFMRTLPHVHNMDGFFAALFIKE